MADVAVAPGWAGKVAWFELGGDVEEGPDRRASVNPLIDAEIGGGEGANEALEERVVAGAGLGTAGI